MPTIHENRFFTPIIEFEVAPEQQQAFIDETADASSVLEVRPDAVQSSFESH